MARWNAVLWCACAVAFGGCIRDPLVPCGDLLCPAREVCTATGCATQEQIDACAGSSEAAGCTTRQFAIGVCADAVCRPLVCGDQIVLGPEQCDDGNQVSGDGCSGDCLSTETCGNDYVDTLVGEQCDAGLGGLSNDGCTSTCTIEVDSWLEVTPGLPAARYDAGLAIDARRNRAVMFGGSDAGGVFGETWEWDGTAWRHLRPASTPDARTRFAMAYDAERGVVILFGGTDGVSTLSDTWAWDGLSWTKQAPAVAPPPREKPVMTYDPVRRELVMFGGVNGAMLYTDTWIWNGATWIDRTTAPSPTQASENAMAWDAQGSRVILFSGTDRTTWSWTGTAWTSLFVASPPTTRSLTRMAEDGAGIILYGGRDPSINAFTSDTWRWANGAWGQLGPMGNAGVLAEQAMAYDADRGRIVMFGGRANFCCIQSALWEWSATTWSAITPVAAPPVGGQGRPAAAYQPLAGTTLLLVGSSIQRSTTWEWDGIAWSLRPTVVAPESRHDHAMAATPDRVVMFGGQRDFGGLQQDTWSWNGSAWALATPVTVPERRSGHAMAYDARRDRVVMFGGGNGGGVLDETVVWDGVDWTERTPAHSPPARRFAAMAYDPVRERTVLFGGVGIDNSILGDTWEWDGDDWTEIPTPIAPSARQGAGLAYHAARGRLVLFGGGRGQSGDLVLTDTWEWDGTAWRLLAPAVSPPRRSMHTQFYDAVHAQLVVFGGLTQQQQFTDTWAYQFSSQAVPADHCIDVDTDEDGLAGCADPDCWARCAPLCPPGATCDPAAPRCGDRVCSALEDRRLCAADCP